MKPLPEVLNHVVTFGLAMNEEVEANFLLEIDDGLDLLLDELVVLFFGDFLLAELGTSLTDLFGLLCGEKDNELNSRDVIPATTYRERTDGCRRELGEVDHFLLSCQTLGERILAVQVLGFDCGNTLADRVV